MKIYTEHEILRIARRFNNSRRNYLLVNPLQGKHLPVSPKNALEMMNSLGFLIANGEFSSARLVIGFAETATAIGAVVAKNLSDDCFYLQTTREKFSGNFIYFVEEHSHAPEQRLFADNFAENLEKTSEIVFVDDELSTGKTLLNIVRQLKREFPALDGKKICAASIINRLSDENLKILASENIFCVSLVKLDKTFNAENFSIEPAREISSTNKNCPIYTRKFIVDPRKGIEIGKYFSECERAADFVVEMIRHEKISGKILILGTEEFMLPAIIAGNRLESANFDVKTHSTTRSPIGICLAENYPIQLGFKLRSFYDENRPTFIYNLQRYDAAVIMTDSDNFSAGLSDLVAVLNDFRTKNIFLVRC